ncbi:MAG: hypothetical protein ACRDHP_00930 [Ktedonobacterales bacterium]
MEGEIGGIRQQVIPNVVELLSFATGFSPLPVPCAGLSWPRVSSPIPYEEAVGNGKIALDQLIETAQEQKWMLPEPRTVPAA